MVNVLKYFFVIILSCFGIGLSVTFPGFCYFVLTAIFVMLDLVGISFVLRYSKSDLCGTFYTFCPSFVLTEVIRENMFIAEAETKTTLLSLECSFILVLVGLSVYSVILCLRKKRVSIRN